MSEFVLQMSSFITVDVLHRIVCNISDLSAEPPLIECIKDRKRCDDGILYAREALEWMWRGLSITGWAPPPPAPPAKLTASSDFATGPIHKQAGAAKTALQQFANRLQRCKHRFQNFSLLDEIKKELIQHKRSVRKTHRFR